MFDEENESSIEQMQAASMGTFMIIGCLMIIALLVSLYFMGEK